MSLLGQLFQQDIRVVNLGLSSFAEPVAQAGADAVDLDWRPPAAGDERIGLRLAQLTGVPAIEEANQRALETLLSAQPRLIDVSVARDAIPALAEGRTILHAGPPIEWAAMCGPMRGAIVGAILLEEWAADAESAERLAASGAISFLPNHHAGSVGPMAGVISPSMPVLVVEDAATGRRAHSNLNEGLGKALRFGANGEDVLQRLRWMGRELGPALSAALRALPEPLDLKAITAQALQMGDEGHNRNVAATSLVARRLAPVLARQDGPAGLAAMEFLRDNDHFFLNMSMAACKVALDAAHGIPGSTMVTAMARNGVEFGLRVSGCGDRWFTAPATVPDGLFFPGYGPDDANPDLGDSAITETAGIGGFAMAASPAIVGFVGGTSEDAVNYSREMATITIGRSREYQLPALGFVGSPTGIDIRAVLDSNVLPVINTGIAHRKPGVGQIGAGVARAPLACFAAALDALEVPA
jgi:CheY-like chemotaxis protein